MTNEEWKYTLSKAYSNISKEIVVYLKSGQTPPQSKLIAEEIIHQIFKAL